MKSIPGGEVLIRRRGVGMAVIVAVSLPVVIFIGALAMSYRSSSARKHTSSFYLAYVAHEIAESAIAEVAHEIKLEDVFDPALFKDTDKPDFPLRLLNATIHDGLSQADMQELRTIHQKLIEQGAGGPGGAAAGAGGGPAGGAPAGGAADAGAAGGPPGGGGFQPLAPEILDDLLVDPSLFQKETRDVTDDSTGAVDYKMLTAFLFPDRPPGSRLAKKADLTEKVAAEEKGILTGGPYDFLVEIRPMVFRREFYPDFPGLDQLETRLPGAPDPQTRTKYQDWIRDLRSRFSPPWVNWGVVQFRVRVRVKELKGTVVHELKVDRRFSLDPSPASNEKLKISSQNLRTVVSHEEE